MHASNIDTKGLQAVFGILTDIQYGDLDDVEESPSRRRFYRNSVNRAKEAVQDWHKLEETLNTKLRFLLNLGDLIEGTRVKSKQAYIQNLDRVLNELKQINDDKREERTHLFHIWGNHEFYAFKVNNDPDMSLGKSELCTASYLSQPKSKNRNYYSYDATSRLRLICLDQYELAVIGLDESEPDYKTASEMLGPYLASLDVNDPKNTSLIDRLKNWNGGVSDEQLEWLSSNLAECRESNKKVILCGHIPLLNAAADWSLVWNAEEILELMWSFTDVVLIYIAGHYHPGGYFKDEHGIPHLTLPGMLERSPTKSNTYLTGLVYEDRLVIKNESDQNLDFSFTL